MTWEEAKVTMKAGKKVTHNYFASNEHFEMQRGVLVCEDGYSMRDWFTGEPWQLTGWSIKE